VKETATRGSTDLDILVSLRSDTPVTLKDIYYNLNDFLTANGLRTQLRNVSIQVHWLGFAIDIVPGRRQHALGGDHSLFSRRRDSWLQTNPYKHLALVTGSPRRVHIRLTKIWRDCHGLDFPSFYLELSVLEALRGRAPLRLAANMVAVLNFLATEFEARRLLDPANSNNIVSDELTREEKASIRRAAQRSLAADNWGTVVW
jgi:hypothetical protein